MRSVGGAVDGSAADPHRVVPGSGIIARLTLLVAGAMAFLAVFALALAFSAGALAQRWEVALAASATVVVSVGPERREAEVAAVMEVLATTPGIRTPRRLDLAETQALLAPWLGAELPVDTLPLPVLIAVETGRELDSAGLRLRLAAEAPTASYDDHARWREPLLAAAARMRLIAALALGLIGAATAAMIALAAQAALSANRQVIEVLRLVGARDRFIRRAFVRQFTWRSFAGASAGTGLGLLALVYLRPGADEAATAASAVSGLGFEGAGWLWPLVLPPLAAIVAYVATTLAAWRNLKGLG